MPFLKEIVVLSPRGQVFLQLLLKFAASIRMFDKYINKTHHETPQKYNGCQKTFSSCGFYPRSSSNTVYLCSRPLQLGLFFIQETLTIKRRKIEETQVLEISFIRNR